MKTLKLVFTEKSVYDWFILGLGEQAFSRIEDRMAGTLRRGHLQPILRHRFDRQNLSIYAASSNIRITTFTIFLY